MSPARSLHILRIVGLFGIASLVPAASLRAEEGSCHSARKIGSEIRVSNDDQRSARPQLILAGEEIGIFWHSGSPDAGTTRFGRFTREGSPVAPVVTLPGVKEGPVAWDGAGYATAYPTPLAPFGVMGLELARLEPDGGLAQTLLIPALYARASTMVWTGAEFGVAFEALNDSAHMDTWLARVNAEGDDLLTVLGPTGDDNIRPRVQWDGNAYGLALDATGPDPSRNSFWLVDPEDGPVAVRHDSYGSNSFVQQLLWTGTQYAQLVRVRNDDSDIPPFVSYMNFFQGTERIASELLLEMAEPNRMAFSGTAFGLTGGIPGSEGLWFQALDASGAADGEPVELSPTGTGEAAVHWTGDGYTAAWEDTRDGRSEIYMARIGCNCAAADVPGNEVDEDCSGAPLCSPSAPWKGRGAFLTCVSRECARLTAEGLLTQAECSQALRQAAHVKSSRMTLFRERRHR